MPLKYRKKPVTIDAEQLAEDGSNAQALAAWIGPNARVRTALAKPTDPDSIRAYIDVRTLEGTMTADPGDWIVQEPFPTDDRRFYPVKDAIFRAAYDRVETVITNEPA